MTVTTSPVGKLESITKRYGAKTAVDSIDLDVYAGEVLVVVGPNGSGKTTSLEILSGIRYPDSGKALIAERFTPGSLDARLITGVQLQESRLPSGIKTKEAIQAKSCLFKDPGPVEAVIESMGLGPHLSTSVDKLSGGWQRRLDVAIACIGRPRLLILDEPTSGVDPDGRGDMWHFFREIRSAGTAIVTSTHDLAEAEAFADRMTVLAASRVTKTGTVAEILEQAGGEWRLRIEAPDERVEQIVLASGLEIRRLPNSLSVFGSQNEVKQLSRILEERYESGEIRYLDLLVGAVRLEDIFASLVATTKAERNDDGND